MKVNKCGGNIIDVTKRESVIAMARLLTVFHGDLSKFRVGHDGNYVYPCSGIISESTKNEYLMFP